MEAPEGLLFGPEAAKIFLCESRPPELPLLPACVLNPPNKLLPKSDVFDCSPLPLECLSVEDDGRFQDVLSAGVVEEGTGGMLQVELGATGV